MSHYSSDFYLQIAVTGKRNLKDFKKWTLEKLDRDFNKKIFFDFAKDEVKIKKQGFKDFNNNESGNFNRDSIPFLEYSIESSNFLEKSLDFV